VANRELILDGLAWAGIDELVRVAKISAILVREAHRATYTNAVTKTRIKEAVRDTSPPYGRGKAICELVETEFKRQMVIYQQRQNDQLSFGNWKTHRAKHDTRLNDAYAFAFDRPTYEPHNHYPDGHSVSGTEDWDARSAWDDKESERDKGDKCLAITHWQEHVVALVRCQNGETNYHIATRMHKGEIVRTRLRRHDDDLVQAAISLGGPRVRAALAVGVRITTDWIGRCTTVHYTSAHKPEMVIPWRSQRAEKRENDAGYVRSYEINTLIMGRTEEDDTPNPEVSF